MNNPTKKSSWKHKLHEIIYEADTPEGKLFDVILLIAIIASIILVMLESVESIDNNDSSIFLKTLDDFIKLFEDEEP